MTQETGTPLRSERERIRRVEALRFEGSAAVPELLAELVQPSWSVRRAVVAVLAAGVNNKEKEGVVERWIRDLWWDRFSV